MVGEDKDAPGEVPIGAEGRSGWAVDVVEAFSAAADGKAEVKDEGVGVEVFFDFPFPFPLAALLGHGAPEGATEPLEVGAAVAAEGFGAARGGEVAAGVDDGEVAVGGVAPETTSGLLHSASCC